MAAEISGILCLRGSSIQQFPRYKPNHSKKIKIADYRSGVECLVSGPI
jgi:hypothetical protein